MQLSARDNEIAMLRGERKDGDNSGRGSSQPVTTQMVTSETSLRLHNANDYLYMMGDFYIADELIAELQAHDS